MLAIICGAGALPKAVADAHPGPVLVCALDGFLPDRLSVDLSFRLESLGHTLAFLQQRGVQAVCFCGKIERPKIDPDQIDAMTAPLVPKLRHALGLGDDRALRIVLQIFEEAGFDVLAPQNAAPALLVNPGVPTQAQPPNNTVAQLGDAASIAMGQADLGQACVIAPDGSVLTEDETGTDALLARAPAGSVLYKAPKPDQDRRADLPVIGPTTAHAAVVAQLTGIIIEARGVIVLEQSSVVATLDAAGLFLWARDRGA